MFTYREFEKGIWTVGHYDPKTSDFISESDHDAPEDASRRVAFLNGGSGSGDDKTFSDQIAERKRNLEPLSQDVLPETKHLVAYENVRALLLLAEILNGINETLESQTSHSTNPYLGATP